jgi:hypothetical protein
MRPVPLRRPTVRRVTERRSTPLPLPRFVMEDDEELPTVVRESGIRQLYAPRQTQDDSVRVVVDLAANDDHGALEHTRLTKAARSTRGLRDEPDLENENEKNENESLGMLVRIYERRAATVLRPAAPEERWDDVGEQPAGAQRRSRPSAPKPTRPAAEDQSLLAGAELYFEGFDVKRWVAFVAASAALASLLTVLLAR